MVKKKKSKSVSAARHAPKTVTKKAKVKDIGVEKGPSKKVKDKESYQLVWFLAVVIVIFLSFLIPYFYVADSKKFEFGNITFVEEDYQGLKIYHGIFGVLTLPSSEFNIFLRIDPRENSVPVMGKLDRFNYDGIISLSEELEMCRGEVSRVMIDLGSFLRGGVGMNSLEVATTSWKVSQDQGKLYADCSIGGGVRTVIMIEKGESVVFRSPKNDHCYVIRVTSCEDIEPIEKFIVRTISDFKESH